MKHEFDKPVKFEEKEYKHIDLNLDSLTGKDMSVIKRQWAGEGNFSPVPAADMTFCEYVAAHASKMPQEFFEALPAKEYMKVTQAVSNFLLT
ncbi:MAG: phage tail assembly protein [Methyloprofundus sp.]|nr:phage tail assembly protein [Methyloprofundus sp.]